MFSRAAIRCYRGLVFAATVAAGLVAAYPPPVNAADDKPESAAQATGQALYARVGDREITIDEYNRSYFQTVRNRYYHAKPPATELAAVRKEIGEELIIRELLLMEAARLGMKPNEAAIQAELEKYDRRYADSPQWKEQRATMLGALKPVLERKDLLKQIEDKIKGIAPPTDAQLEAYYRQYPEKFTEPSQMKLSLILLVVDPSSPTEVWQAAQDKGEDLVRQLKEGADFAELASIHSGDVSADEGGDMGYVHREMLSTAVQQKVDALEPGQISEAIRTLQGVAIFRLDDRRPERLRKLADVEERARNLWIRDQSEKAWTEFKRKLRLDTPVTVFVDVSASDNDV